jgi:hypothetical protein
MKSSIPIGQIDPKAFGQGLRPRQIKSWFNLHGIILERKLIGLDQTRKSLTESSWFGEAKCKLGSKVVHFFHFLRVFYSCCSNSMKLEEMLWIKDIVQSTQAPPFLTNFKVDMASFIDPHKVIT